MTKRAAVFVSGSGTNLEALLKRQEAGDLEAQIVTVISDRPDAFGLTRARDHGISSHYVQAKGRDKKDYESEVLDILRRAEVELIILAGYMRFVGPTLLAAYPNAIINIHPAYLPEFPGAHGILDAWNAGVKETGVTVHYVDEGVDTGPVILQERVPVPESGGLEALEAAVHAKEYDLFWRAVNQAVHDQD
ncbi:phosphoribosylglycinamide formyltransferase [Faecalibaculum rodentium]|uniref:Phosphoribosylglycinamide formyltransferase n=1 Tax=Faecalibaculum rodentium TaxID=1702221 RepID=A0A140DR93_9FIRM|nr:phosphoribosylglycinamide formyltransferase [Faecalibaculum rodentium]AMK53170.1 phosphoribosylglycinamide formyltransferase [Faecalibaculum rodentium]